MIKLILKGIDFGAEDINTFAPEMPHNFCTWLTMTIGPQDVEGGHLFQVGVCTAEWLAHQLVVKNPYILRHMILVENFKFEEIKGAILEIIEKSERSNWDESLQILSRYFAWEYEDYQS